MLTQICAEINNYFSLDSDKFIGDFEIISGDIVPSLSIQENQYFRVIGSIFNDGVHKFGDESDILTDEPKFHGEIWLMRVPKDLIKLSEDVEDWLNNNSSIITSPYQSESFGGYSYTKASGGTNGEVSDYSWKNAFASRLNRYRKVCNL